MAIESKDLTVIGAGPAGLAAAAEVSRFGGRVIVIDEAPRPGGRLPSQIHFEPGRTWKEKKRLFNGPEKAERLKMEAEDSGAQILCGVSAWGLFPGWDTALSPTVPGPNAYEIPGKIRSKAVIVSTGAFQNPLVIDGWTLPGVITAGAAQTLINVYQVLPGRKAAFIGIDPLNISVAQLMKKAGADILGVVLPPSNGLQLGPTKPKEAIKDMARFANYAPNSLLKWAGRASGLFPRSAAYFYPGSGLPVDGIRLLLRHAAVEISEEKRVRNLVVAALKADGTPIHRRFEKWSVDVVVTAAGLSPLTELTQIAGCPLVNVPELGGWVPAHNKSLMTPLEGLFVAGSITGIEGSPVAEAQGRLSGLAASRYLDLIDSGTVEHKMHEYIAAVESARHASIPFLSNIRIGRDRAIALSNDFFSFKKQS